MTNTSALPHKRTYKYKPYVSLNLSLQLSPSISLSLRLSLVPLPSFPMSSAVVFTLRPVCTRARASNLSHTHTPSSARRTLLTHSLSYFLSRSLDLSHIHIIISPENPALIKLLSYDYVPNILEKRVPHRASHIGGVCWNCDVLYFSRFHLFDVKRSTRWQHWPEEVWGKRHRERREREIQKDRQTNRQTETETQTQTETETEIKIETELRQRQRQRNRQRKRETETETVCVYVCVCVILCAGSRVSTCASRVR